MAGAVSKTVTLNIVGNTDGATKALDEVAGKSETTGKRASAAFGGVLSTLNSTGVLGPFGESLDKLGGLFDTLTGKGKGLGQAMLGVGAAGVGIGGILTAAAGPDQAAAQQLQQAIQNVGGSYDDYKEKIEATVSANEKFGTTANTTQDAIRILTQGTGNAGTALDMMGEASNLAAAKHESLSAAATDLVKVYEGKGTRVLTQFGLATADTSGATKALTSATKDAQSADETLSSAKQKLADVHAELAGKTKLTTAEQIKLRDAEQAVTTDTAKASDAHTKLKDAQTAAAGAAKDQSGVLDQLGQKLTGQAAAASDSFSGKMKALKAEVEDGAAKLGQKYGPAVMAVSTGITALGGVMEGASAVIGKFKTTQEAATTATEGLTAATDAQDVSEGIALAPILLIVAAVAAVGVAIYELWTHWSDIWGWIKGVILDVWGWIKDNWPLLLGILTGPIGLAVVEIIKHWDDIKNAFTAVKDWIGNRIDDIVGFFTGLGGKIARVAVGMFDGIKDAFKAAINLLIDVWDALNFKVGGWKVGPITVPTVDLGLPHIPHLAAGGIVSSPTFALIAEAGPEAVVPLGRAGGLGATNSVTVGEINVYAAPGQSVDEIAEAVRVKLLQTQRRNINVGLA